MARVEGVQAVIRALKGKMPPEKEPSVVVGYTQNYALYVHENMTANHPVGQAKFLEQPFRSMQSVIANVISTAMRRGASLLTSLLLGGLRLQRESQKLVPVDTGALKNSAFTAAEEDWHTAASQANAVGEAKRQEAMAQRVKARGQVGKKTAQEVPTTETGRTEP